jgi:hypothetical protein
MQTFLPYPDFRKSAQCLDYRRLGKQRVEVLQLLNTFMPEYSSKGWLNHPARLMWKNYEVSLAVYGLAICDEWKNRDYKDTCYDKILHLGFRLANFKTKPFYIYKPHLKLIDCSVNPPWFGNEDFHASHRSNLLRKDRVWYDQFGWKEPNNLPYIWPKASLQTSNNMI